MGILINTGFDLGSNSPIDSRTVKNTIGERDALISDGLVYENLKVYCKDTQKEYRWTGTEWETVGSSSGTGDIDLSEYYTKTEVDNDFLKKTDAASTYATKTELNEKANDDEVAKKADITDLQEQIDNLDIPEDVDLTEINDKLTELENNQIKKSYITRLATSGTDYFKIKPCGQNTFSKILITDVYGGCILITGSLMNDNSTYSFKVVRLSNGSWVNSLPSNNTLNKILNVYNDGSYIYLTVDSYVNLYIEGGYTNIETTDSIPSEATQLPILDLTQQTDLTGINTKLSQLETKADLIPVAVDNPTTSYDLNYYIENGNYSICDSSKYSNVPINRPALLTVIMSGCYRLQIYTVVNTDDVYFRKSIDWGRTWLSWVLLNGSSGASGNGHNYSTNAVAVGTWVGGQTLYRITLVPNKTITVTSTSEGSVVTEVLCNINTQYQVVKMEGIFKYNSGNISKICTIPCTTISDNMQINIIHSSTGDIVLQGKNVPVCNLTDIAVSIYYYKK